jgi:undecaprenyl-diphosphatase
MDLLQTLVVAVLQGATELFPVSSLGHAVVIPALLGWNMDQQGSAFLPFLVLLHTGTAAALLVYFWRDWWSLARGVLGLASAETNRACRRVLWLIIIATIPAVVVGFALEHALRSLFGSAPVAAAFLVVNAGVLLLGERLRGRQGRGDLATMTPLHALWIGLWQCGALIPGISRSGTTIVGGLLCGLNHETSARFSFLIALPIILGATVLEVPKLLHADIAPGVFQTAAIAAVLAGVTAYLSTAFLMRYFRGNDTMALNPFAYYCAIFGLGSLAWLLA